MSLTFVALDLETTGIDPAADAIIEIGAVKFDGAAVSDRFQTLVKPHRPLPERVQALTGIGEEDLRDAPILEVVAGDLEAFLGDHPLVGHNIVAFDARFLDAKRIRHSPVIFDTYDLASLLLPGAGQYSLKALAQRFQIPFPVQHRALPDAQAAGEVFQALRRRAAALPPAVLSQVAAWLSGSKWPWRTFFAQAPSTGSGQALEEATGGAAPTHPFAIPRPAIPEPLTPERRPTPIDAEETVAILASAGEQPDVIPCFEERPEQRTMTSAVASALADGRRFMVEAGTGTGKSLAYLIPAACHALASGSRVVVSTATINLQEQLSTKDIPALKSLLKGWQPPGQPARELRTAQLKGRRNYLCLRRFAALQGAAPPWRDDEAKLMARLLIWLTATDSGDRSELNLSPAEEALWPPLSAEGMDCQAQNCPFVADGTCFLWRARRSAEAAHIVVANHALLLSDVAVGGYLLPPYDNLIVDEAHHLEEEATRQLGFSVREEAILDLLERCARLAPSATGGRAALAEAAGRARPRVSELAEAARAFLRQHAPGPDRVGEPAASGDYDARLLIDRAMRIQPDWSQVEVAWDNLRLALTNVLHLLDSLAQGLAEAGESGLLNYELLVAEAGALQQEGQALLEGIAAGIEGPDRVGERIVWLEENRQRGSLTLAWAPLSVAETLRDRLYAGKNAVILTGATLTTTRVDTDQGGFQYLRERLGLEDAGELSLGSSFDYGRAALILLPKDMPEPNQPGYLETLAQAISDLARASQGRALVLFTAHSSLRAAYPRVRSALQGEGIDVLGQGIDGRPSWLLQSLRSNPRTVLLGTASFWEGVDVAGEALSLLVIARLPFNVPTEPVFAARAALYDDPFHQYALPQAVLRFKQGFGRLIRTKEDRGLVAVLDRRIVSKRYGSAFLDSLPPCPQRQAMLRELPELAARWLKGDEEA